MKTKILRNYIEKHLTFKVGIGGFSGLIVDDPSEFLALVYQSGYYVSSITWWDHRKIKGDETPYLGGGGPRDSKNPDYFYAEVYWLDRKFTPQTTKEEVLNYIREIKKKYPENECHPGFDIQRKDVT